MPGYDGTGPRGMGEMTGGGRGFCAVPLADATYGLRMGRGLGPGRGRGYRNRYYATGLTRWQRNDVAPVDETVALKRDKEILQEELTNIQKRLETLDK